MYVTLLNALLCINFGVLDPGFDHCNMFSHNWELGSYIWHFTKKVSYSQSAQAILQSQMPTPERREHDNLLWLVWLDTAGMLDTMSTCAQTFKTKAPASGISGMGERLQIGIFLTSELIQMKLSVGI